MGAHTLAHLRTVLVGMCSSAPSEVSDKAPSQLMGKNADRPGDGWRDGDQGSARGGEGEMVDIQKCHGVPPSFFLFAGNPLVIFTRHQLHWSAFQISPAWQHNRQDYISDTLIIHPTSFLLVGEFHQCPWAKSRRCLLLAALERGGCKPGCR